MVLGYIFSYKRLLSRCSSALITKWSKMTLQGEPSCTQTGRSSSRCTYNYVLPWSQLYSEWHSSTFELCSLRGFCVIMSMIAEWQEFGCTSGFLFLRHLTNAGYSVTWGFEWFWFSYIIPCTNCGRMVLSQYAALSLNTVDRGVVELLTFERVERGLSGQLVVQ